MDIGSQSMPFEHFLNKKADFKSAFLLRIQAYAALVSASFSNAKALPMC